jgi:hypothetical protein
MTACPRESADEEFYDFETSLEKRRRVSIEPAGSLLNGSADIPILLSRGRSLADEDTVLRLAAESILSFHDHNNRISLAGSVTVEKG